MHDWSELEAMEEVDTDQEVVREPRRKVVLEAPFNPLSLLGSWALYHNGELTEQGLMVCEPQPGIYLVEMFHVVTDTPMEQRLIPLADLAKRVDDSGGSWQFYDNREDVRAAFIRIASKATT